MHKLLVSLIHTNSNISSQIANPKFYFLFFIPKANLKQIYPSLKLNTIEYIKVSQGYKNKYKYLVRYIHFDIHKIILTWNYLLDPVSTSNSPQQPIQEVLCTARGAEGAGGCISFYKKIGHLYSQYKSKWHEKYKYRARQL